MTFQKPMIYLLRNALVLFLAACVSQQNGGPAAGQTASPDTPSGSPGLPPEAVLEAQQWLAEQLSVTIKQVQIIDVEQAEWTDSCLGLGQPNESCAQVITPGWRAVFNVNGQTYEVHTDEAGSIIRLASPEGTIPTEIGLENTHWSLVSFGPAGTGEPLVEGSDITLLLADGQGGGYGGCNSYGTTYQVEGNHLSFEHITSTLRACVDGQVTQQEQQYFQTLESVSSYELEGNHLRLTYDDGNGLMIFETPVRVAPTE